MFLHDYLLACGISTVRTQTLKPYSVTFLSKMYQTVSFIMHKKAITLSLSEMFMYLS